MPSDVTNSDKFSLKKGRMRMKMPTMTPEEVCEELRTLGVKTSPEKIRAGIDQGVYPFGVVIHLASPCYEIYRVKFNQWVRENIKQ